MKKKKSDNDTRVLCGSNALKAKGVLEAFFPNEAKGK